MHHPSQRARSAVSCEYHGCPNAAAMVQLLPGPSPQGTLVVDGFTEGPGYAEPLYDARLAEQVRAAGVNLAPALFDRDPAWAPFYCPVCERAYCAEHWRGRRCPYGHRQF